MNNAPARSTQESAKSAKHKQGGCIRSSSSIITTSAALPLSCTHSPTKDTTATATQMATPSDLALLARSEGTATPSTVDTCKGGGSGSGSARGRGHRWMDGWAGGRWFRAAGTRAGPATPYSPTPHTQRGAPWPPP